jgi:hypothetical protein
MTAEYQQLVTNSIGLSLNLGHVNRARLGIGL